MEQIYIDDFIKWLKEDNRSDKTILVYINALKKLAAWYECSEVGPFDPGKITTLDIHDFRTYIDKNEKLSPATVNKIIAALKTYFNYASDKKVISYNPSLKVKMKRTVTQHEAPKWLTVHELAKFYHAIEQNKNDEKRARDMAICRLMSGAGLRVQEVSDLNISDVCLEKRREDVIIRSGKGDKYRIVPLNGDIIDSLNTWLQYRYKYSNQGFLFVTKNNESISVRTIHYMVSKYGKRAGLSNVSPHTLRHTFCKNLVDHGVTLDRVALLAGHNSIETTKQYTKPSKSDLRKDVNSISDIK